MIQNVSYPSVTLTGNSESRSTWNRTASLLRNSGSILQSKMLSWSLAWRTKKESSLGLKRNREKNIKVFLITVIIFGIFEPRLHLHFSSERESNKWNQTPANSFVLSAGLARETTYRTEKEITKSSCFFSWISSNRRDHQQQRVLADILERDFKRLPFVRTDRPYIERVSCESWENWFWLQMKQDCAVVETWEFCDQISDGSSRSLGSPPTG